MATVIGLGDIHADDADAAEVAWLWAEVSQLWARLDIRSRRSAALGGLRSVTAAMLVALTAFMLVASVVGLWAARTALDTDRWVATVTPLPRDPQVLPRSRSTPPRSCSRSSRWSGGCGMSCRNGRSSSPGR